MKALRTLRHACLLPVTGVLILCLHPVAARAASTPESQVESRLGGGTILNSSADKLIQAVGDSAKQTPQRAGGIVTAALAGGRADSDAIAPRVTVAAIEGLGSNPSPALVGQIITAAVKATPAVVLEIVRAAAKAAPNCTKAIVIAAIAAVPDPNAKIQPLGSTADSNSNTSPPSDGLSKDDGKDLSKEDGQLLPIAEAIAQAANYTGPLTPDPTSPPNVYPGYYYPPLVDIAPKPPEASK